MRNPSTDRYPRTFTHDGATFDIRRMSPDAGEAIRAFVARLPPHDLLFLRRDITNAKVVAAWMTALGTGQVHSLALYEGNRLAGCTAIVTEDMSWSQHVGELRVLLDPGLRGKGVGQLLVQECFATALGLGLRKLCVKMTVDQQGAIAVFESLGFRAEALLRNHVRDRDGGTHDLVVLSHDVAEVQSCMDVYGMSDALGTAQASG